MHQREINSHQILEEENSHILLGLEDLLAILASSHADYRIFGSVLTTAAIGSWFRKLGDIEVLIDCKHKIDIISALLTKGYSPNSAEEMEKLGHKTLKNVTNGNVIGFVKGKITLSLHFADFTESGAIIKAGFGFYGRFPLNAIEATKYKLGKVQFIGLPAEVQYIMLQWKSLVDGEGSKAKNDFQRLERRIDRGRVKEILSEKPGIYWGKTALPIKIIFALVGLKNTFPSL